MRGRGWGGKQAGDGGVCVCVHVGGMCVCACPQVCALTYAQCGVCVARAFYEFNLFSERGV